MQRGTCKPPRCPTTCNRPRLRPRPATSENRYVHKFGEARYLGEHEAIEFLRALRLNGPWLLIAIDPDGGVVGTRCTRHGSRVIAFIRRWNGVANIYFTPNRTPSNLTKKPRKADIVAVEFVHADLDPRHDESPKKTKTRYLEAIDKLALPPSLIVDSGNGLQCLWRLKEPVPPEYFDRCETISGALMMALGEPDISTRNIDRILRLPGTTNLPNATKRAAGRVKCRATLLKVSKATYDLADFDSIVAQHAAAKAGSTKSKEERERSAGEMPPMLRSLLHLSNQPAKA